MSIERRPLHESYFSNIDLEILYFGRSSHLDDMSTDMYRHPSLFNRLWYITGGKALLTMNGTETTLRRGMMCLIPVNTKCAVDTAVRLDKVWVDFRLPIYSLVDAFELVHPRVTRPFSSYRSSPVFRYFKSTNMLHSAVMKQRIMLDALSFIGADDMKLFDERLRNVLEYRTVLDYISRHLSIRLTVHDLANAAGVSGYYLSAKFRKDMGIGLKQYIDRRIIAAAQQELRGARSMREIARGLGFRDITYFSTYFKHHMGISPMAYRHMPSPERMVSGRYRAP
ncbi:MAG: helix-turn-helix transcriptional regulator [Spirochaetes bacterium]|nr:helix-turn-helix transcriptional regulator [Spirochaetota bacterium]